MPDKKSTGESSRWMLESIHVDNGGPNEDGSESVPSAKPPLTRSVSNASSSLSRTSSSLSRTKSNMGGAVTRNQSTTKKRNAAPSNQPQKIERTASSATRGLNGLRFLDRTVTGRETDAWKSIERRFNQFATPEGKLPKEKFGICAGN
ncbi:hypothetical protein ACFE04_013118 [Oxalis oulophora]